MTPSETANQLLCEAEMLLRHEALWTPFTISGNLHVAGSAYLDLLVYPDLDLYYEPAKGVDQVDVIAKTSTNLLNLKEVTSLECEKEMHLRNPSQVPEGIFLQYRIKFGSHLWKVDIWTLRDNTLLKTILKELASFKERMTSEQRELILLAKHELMAPFGRTPVGSSYLVYKAVIDEGRKTMPEIISYLKEHGGNVDRLK